MSQITSKGTWSYEYDFLGNRIASVHDGVRTEYLVDPSGRGNVVGEYHGEGNLVAHYTQGFGLASRVDAAGQAAYYSFDAAGNTTELTSPTGSVLNSYSYLPFGEALRATETVINPFRYVGQLGVMRDGSGLDYMRHRWYAPEQGRFTQPDPIGLAGGTNLYAYVGNDPESLVDPSGLGGPSQNITGEQNFADQLTQLNKELKIQQTTVARFQADITGLDTVGAEISAAREASALANGSHVANYGEEFGMAVRNPRIAFPAVKPAEVPAARPTGGLNSAGAAVVIGVGLEVGGNAFSQLSYFRSTGEMAPCVDSVAIIPGVIDIDLPHSLQACEDPGSNVLDKLLNDLLHPLQRVTIKLQDVAEDPNDIIGPAGFGPQGYIDPQAPLAYHIDFQNKPDALGPAEEVVVTHVLAADLDLDTFELGPFGFGDLIIDVPANRQFYSTRLDLRSTRGVFVDITAKLNRATHTATWTFQALDPETMDLPSDPSVGFLPPDRTAPEGQGFVTFNVRARANLASGTRIDALATIVFDTNAPLNTAAIFNTLDSGSPSSRVAALPPLVNSGFTVMWSGADEIGGSGLASFDVLVSDNGGSFSPWQTGTTQTSATFTGQAEHNYRFYSIAKDNVGHAEVAPTTADATTLVTILIPWQNILNRFDVDDSRDVSPLDVLVVINDLNTNGFEKLPLFSSVLTHRRIARTS